MPKTYTLVSIVEGEGEMFAVPALIENWLGHKNFRNFEIENPAVCTRGCGKLKAPYDQTSQSGIEYFVRNALPRRPHGILIILDSDDECIQRQRNQLQKLGPELLQRAIAVADGVPVSVVIANRTIEAWIVANSQRLKQTGYFPKNVIAPKPQYIEAVSGHKTKISKWLQECRGYEYESRPHMWQLTSRFGFSKAAQSRSPSYGKFVRDLENLVVAARRFKRERGF